MATIDDIKQREGEVGFKVSTEGNEIIEEGDRRHLSCASRPPFTQTTFLPGRGSVQQEADKRSERKKAGRGVG